MPPYGRSTGGHEAREHCSERAPKSLAPYAISAAVSVSLRRIDTKATYSGSIQPVGAALQLTRLRRLRRRRRIECR